MNSDNPQISKIDPYYKFKASVFFAALSGFSFFAGFAGTLAMAKRKDTKYFNRGISGEIGMTSTGANLALKALGLGSLYAITGCGIIFFSIYKLSGANDLKDFRIKMGNFLPKLTPNGPANSRTEFDSFRDLMKYLEDKKDD